MTPSNDTHVLLRAFANELARCGLEHVCTSPGSRSSPIVAALVREARLTCHSHIDERCAGFFAVGAARAAGLPVAVVCTSGTAAAELHAAIVEAREGRVPMLVLTADRPPELREVGAGQAIDQLALFGSAAKWFFDVGTHDATPERVAWIRALACRAYWTALDGRPGAVHLNFALREPLVPDGPVDEPPGGRAGGRPWVTRRLGARDGRAGARALAQVLEGTRRPVIVAGSQLQAAGPPTEAAAPLLADPLSGARGGGAAVAHYDLLLSDEGFAEAHRPDAVIRIGDLPTSKPLRAWLAGNRDAVQVALDPEAAWQDPAAVLSHSLALGAESLAGDASAIGCEAGWLDSWRDADRLAAAAIDDALGPADVSEPWVARELGRALPTSATLFVASSMPVRDVESFWELREDAPRVLSNRGANGIDGTVSSAYGAAAVAAGGPAVLLIGDVALAHDVGGLLAARRLGLELTIVVVNNDGGGIFEFLPVAGVEDIYEQHVATPHGLDLAHACALYGIELHRPGDRAAFTAALQECIAGSGGMIEVRTRREQNLVLHRELRAAVARALATA